MTTNPSRTDLIIVGCGARKLSHAAPARDLYTSNFFQAKRRYAEASGCPWMIASALHGLLLPGQIIEPYEYNLTLLIPSKQYAWRQMVRKQFAELEFAPDEQLHIELHAGVEYRSQIRLAIDHPATFAEPTASMGIGQQLHWYAVQHQEAA